MDSIADLLNRIYNASAVLHPTVYVPFSNFKYEIAKILEKQGIVQKIEKGGKKAKKIIKINLKYKDKEPVVSGFKRVSKQGLRVYVGSQDVYRVTRGPGTIIISTTKGLMTARDAKRKGLGGEVICQIW